MKMKLKKTLTAVSAAAVGAGAIAVLALAGQGLAFAAAGPSYPTNFDTASYSGATDANNFAADVLALCGTASQPFANASDPQIGTECSSNGRSVP